MTDQQVDQIIEELREARESFNRAIENLRLYLETRREAESHKYKSIEDFKEAVRPILPSLPPIFELQDVADRLGIPESQRTLVIDPYYRYLWMALVELGCGRWECDGKGLNIYANPNCTKAEIRAYILRK